MNASANPSAVLSSGDGVGGNGPMRRTTAKPQQRFADVPVLAGLKVQTKSDKGTAGKARTPSGPQSQQGTAEAHHRSSRSVPDGSQVATDIDLSDQPAVSLVQPKSNIVKIDFPSKPSVRNGEHRTEDGEQRTKGGELKQTPNSVSQESTPQTQLLNSVSPESTPQSTLIGPVGCWRAVHTQPSRNASSAKEGPSDVTAHATSNSVAAHPDKAPAEVAKPAPVGIDHRSPQLPQEDGTENAAAGPETPSAKVERKGQKATAGESAEKPPGTRAGGNETPANAGSKPPLTPAPVLADRASVTMANSDHASLPKRTSGSRAAAVQAAPGPQQGSAALRTESRQQTASRREDTPAARNRSLEVNGLGDREIPSSQRLEGATVQAEPPASGVGQPAVAAARLSLETQTQGVAEIGAPANNPIRSVGEQILDSVRASLPQGDKQIVIRLQPPELGTVAVRLREQGDHLEGLIEVGKSDVRHAIERALPDVVRGLQEAGVPIRRFDVTSSDSAGSDLGRGLSQQDSGAGQHGSDQPRDHFRSLHTSWSGQTSDHPVGSHETSDSDRPTIASDGRIDMLL